MSKREFTQIITVIKAIAAIEPDVECAALACSYAASVLRMARESGIMDTERAVANLDTLSDEYERRH